MLLAAIAAGTAGAGSYLGSKAGEKGYGAQGKGKFFDKDQEIKCTTVSNSTTKVDSSGEIKYILEMNLGWFDQHDIEIGAIFDIS